MDIALAQNYKNQVYVLSVKDRTLFIKLVSVFPECEFLIEDAPQLFPLRCLKDFCPRNAQCMEKLVKRIRYIFDVFLEAKMLVLYFTYRDRPGSYRAGIFWRDENLCPKYITMNRAVWQKMKDMGTVFEWSLPDSLFLNS